MRKLRFAAGLLILGSLGGLLYLGSLVAKYAVPRADAQTAVNACVSGTCRASRLVLPAGGNMCFNASCDPRMYSVGTALAIWSSGAVYSPSTSALGTVGSPWGNVHTIGTVSSQIASGSNGFACTTNGCRIDLGTGANDYLISTGTLPASPVGFQSDMFKSYNGTGLVVKGSGIATTDNVNVDSDGVALTTGDIITFKNNGTEKASIASDGAIITSSTKTKGTITLAAGTGTATVISGAVCVCSDTTAVNAVQCSVSGTTLTANGTGTDVIAYICL